MATAPPAPPLPPLPPSCGNKPHGISPPPCPGYAAIPYKDGPPVQETSPSPESLHDAEGAPAPPLLPVQNGPQSPPSGQDDNPSDSKEKSCPVQETDPAPQAINGPLITEQQDEAAIQMDQAGEDQLP